MLLQKKGANLPAGRQGKAARLSRLSRDRFRQLRFLRVIYTALAGKTGGAIRACLDFSLFLSLYQDKERKEWIYNLNDVSNKKRVTVVGRTIKQTHDY